MLALTVSIESNHPHFMKSGKKVEINLVLPVAVIFNLKRGTECPLVYVMLAKLVCEPILPESWILSKIVEIPSTSESVLVSL